MKTQTVPYKTISIVVRFAAVNLFVGLMLDRAHSLHAAVPDATPLALSSLLWLSMLLPTFWISLLAPMCYLGALMATATVFTRIDKGDAFGPAMVKGLKSIGSQLMYGAVMAIFIAPTLTFLVGNGFRSLTGMKYHFEIESLTIGLIGLMLYLLASQGAALKAELEQFV